MRRLVALWSKRDRATDLQDHLGHRLAQTPDLVAVLLEVLRDVAGLRIPHVDVQYRGARVVAIDCLLNLGIPAHRDVLGVVGRHPDRPIWRGGYDERFLVFREQRIIGEIHKILLFDWSDGLELS
jgi:hypothetical protein